MGVRASGFDIHSTTDSRDGCWVAFRLCTHEPLPPQRRIQSHIWPFQKSGVNIIFCFVCLFFLFFLCCCSAESKGKTAIPQYRHLLTHVDGAFFFPVDVFSLWLHLGHLSRAGAADVLSGLVPNCTPLLADLKTGNQLKCMIRIGVIAS